MTLLQVMPEDRPEVVELRTRDEQVIADALRPVGVDYFHWELRELPADATPADFLAAYQDRVDALSAEGGYTVVDAVGLVPEDTDEYREKSASARGSFLSEHRHAEDEVRFFAAGRGCFYLHVDGKVMAVVCEAGDLIFSDTNRDGVINHVSLYIGDGKILHTYRVGIGVTISEFEGSTWDKTYVTARRVIPADTSSDNGQSQTDQATTTDDKESTDMNDSGIFFFY